MGKKVKWALLTMLVCNGLFDSEERSSRRAAGPGSDSAVNERQIRLMYGVRPPVPVEEVERQQAIREKTARKRLKGTTGPRERGSGFQNE